MGGILVRRWREWDYVIGLDDDAATDFHFAIGFDEDGEARVLRVVVGVAIRNAVVVHGADGYEAGQFRCAAEMIGVKMGEDETVNFFKPGQFCGGLKNPPGVATAGGTGVNQ